MIRLAVSVEGSTEKEFIDLVLVDYLRSKGIEPNPVSLSGDVTLPRLAKEMATLYRSFDFVTSLVDFYGFRGKGDATPDELQCRIDQEVERNIGREWSQSKVFSYVQRHELESLLFSDVSAFKKILPETPKRSMDTLKDIRRRFHTPEDINDSKDTAPSKRIMKCIDRYEKDIYGPLIAEATGLQIIRTECPRFNEWVTRLESLK